LARCFVRREADVPNKFGKREVGFFKNAQWRCLQREHEVIFFCCLIVEVSKSRGGVKEFFTLVRRHYILRVQGFALVEPVSFGRISTESTIA